MANKASKKSATDAGPDDQPEVARFKFDVFLSHNHADKPKVRKLAERLKLAGVRVWFDEWMIQPGDIIALKVDEGLEQSRVLLLCISPAALASGWVALERSTAVHRDPANAGRRFIPLLLADCDLPDTLRRYRYLDFREESDAAFAEVLATSHAETEATRFHPRSHIPQASKPYVAHPYVLLQTKNVIGRRPELNELTDWITKNEKVPADTRIFSVVAIGGMGKSALTWKWFEDIAPNELPNLVGRMWWSFYESDAHWENFIIRSLAYTAGMPEAEVRQLPSPEREDRLLGLLDERPFLLVLDGLERILLAYARMDAAHLADNDLDQQTANAIAGATGLPDDVRETYLEKHRLRQCTDLRAGAFLRKLARVRSSRVLLSTRLYPAELQTQTAQPLPGCHALFLHGLADDDALALWHSFIGGERSGTSDQLLPLFRAFGNYPLLLRALAGEVAQYRPAPGDFDRWRKDHPDFNPAALPLKNARTHVLEFALRGLGEAQRRVLHTFAAFRMPTTWDTLRALLTGDSKPCSDDDALDAVLTELEDRGLVGWDKQANRYDLHPIVRSVVWKELSKKARFDVYTELNSYLKLLPLTNQDVVKTYDELSNAIELYYNLICLERFDDAFRVFRSRFEMAAIYRLSHSRPCAELLTLLFPDGLHKLPRLTDVSFQIATLNALAQCFHFSGEPKKSAPLYTLASDLIRREKSYSNLMILLYNLSWTLRPSGQLHRSEACSREALSLASQIRDRDRGPVAIQEIGLTLEVRGASSSASVAFLRSTQMFNESGDRTFEGVGYGSLAQLGLHLGELAEAREWADRAWKLAMCPHSEKDLICAARLQGEISIALGDLVLAHERLNHALVHSRMIDFVEEELPALTALAELHRQRKEFDAARELLEQVWAPAERGPYPLWHADARNVLAQIERDLSNTAAAIEAATAAYRLAWCDGPPYAYHYGLTNARRHLHELGAPEPQLPPFDETKFPPMPDVELNPKDQYWVDPEQVIGS